MISLGSRKVTETGPGGLEEAEEPDQSSSLPPAAGFSAPGAPVPLRTSAEGGPRCHRVSVFCADDHAGFRDVVRDLIAATPGFVLVGEASSGTEAVALVPQLLPDVVLMDVHMPGMSGFEAAQQMADASTGRLIVLMSADPIEVPLGLPVQRGDLVCVAKRELCSRRLRDLWEDRRTR